MKSYAVAVLTLLRSSAIFSSRSLKSDAHRTHRSALRLSAGTGTPVEVRQLRVSSSTQEARSAGQEKNKHQRMHLMGLSHLSNVTWRNECSSISVWDFVTHINSDLPSSWWDRDLWSRLINHLCCCLLICRIYMYSWGHSLLLPWSSSNIKKKPNVIRNFLIFQHVVVDSENGKSCFMF